MAEANTSQDSAEKLTSIEETNAIVDTDAHVMETLDEILPYIDDPAAKEILKHAEHVGCEVTSGGPPMPRPNKNSRFGYRLRDSDLIEEGGANPNDPETRTKLNRMFGIDYSIINPGGFGLGLRTVQRDQLAVALMSGYNDWLLDTVLDESGESIKGTILVAGQRPDLAAEEIDRLADEEEFKAVQMLATGHVPPLSHHSYDPIYEAAQDCGLPIQFHSGAGAISHSFPLQSRWHEIYAEDKVISHAFSHQWNLTKMIYQGIPERYPDLVFNFQEAGIAWVPYLTWRLDDYYLEMTEQIPLLNELPSEYVRDQFYFSTQPLGHTGENPDHLARIIEMIGPESILFASDTPHGDFDNPEELFDRIHRHFDADTVNGMMGQYAADVFDLDV